MNALKTYKNNLLLIAGIVWLFAGSMVISVGYPIFIKQININILYSIFAVIVFLIFYIFIFSKLVKKHSNRIDVIPDQKVFFWKFFDLRSYLIMFFMMGIGISFRVLGIFPDWFIGPFYSGLGLALFLCGLKFIKEFIKRTNI